MGTVLELHNQLIEAVHQRRPLWDALHPQHHDRELIIKLWDEVALAVGVSREIAKCKWRSLRDYFRSEQRKALSWSYGEYKSSWSQYERMSFLNESSQRSRRLLNLVSVQSSTDSNSGGNSPSDHIPVGTVVKLEYGDSQEDNANDNQQQAQVRIGNTISLSGPNGQEQLVRIELPGEVGQDVDGHLDKEEAIGPCVPTDPFRTDLEAVGHSRSLVKRSISSMDSKELKKRKVIALERIVEDNDNDDLQFFRSLLPDLRNVPRGKKACIRLKIQELIYKELYGDCT